MKKKGSATRHSAGEDFLLRLENLDPRLVAGADREPEPHSRRLHFYPGTVLAAAACIAVLCLPMILTNMIESGTLRPAGSGGSVSSAIARGFNDSDGTSHESGTSSAADDEAQPGTGVSSDASSDIKAYKYTLYPDGCVSSESESDHLKQTEPPTSDRPWTRYIIEDSPTNDNGEAVPAREYFENNIQQEGGYILEADSADAHTQEAVFSNDGWAQDLIPVPDYGYFVGQKPDINGHYDDNGELTALRIAWNWRHQVEAYNVNENLLLLNISPQPIHNQDSEEAYKKAYGETVGTRGGVELSITGGVDIPKAVTFQLDGMYYRVYGNGTVSPDCIMRLIDDLIQSPVDVSRFTLERGHIMTVESLSEHSEAFDDFRIHLQPTGHKWCEWDMEKSLAYLDNSQAYSIRLEPVSSSENPLKSIEIRDPESINFVPDDDFKEFSLGDITEITDERQLSYTYNYLFQHRTLKLFFTWEGYQVTAEFWPTENFPNVSELYGLIEFLRESQYYESTSSQ